MFLHQQLTMPSLCKTYRTAFESTGDATGNYMLPTLEATNLEPAADGGYAISTWVAVPKPQRSSSSSGSFPTVPNQEKTEFRNPVETHWLSFPNQ